MTDVRRMAAPLLVVAATIASPIAAKPARCPVTELAILGDWASPAESAAGASNDVRILAFDRTNGVREFREWLHDRPMGQGSWQISNCTVIVSYEHGGSARFHFLGNDGVRLVELPYRRGQPVYRRMK